jgi:serine/threonine protein kinase
MKIALGTAEGLKFLHSQDAEIILPDFKATNVLLDAVVCSLPYFCPFGLTK